MESSSDKCSVCKGPFHESTGDINGNMRTCGPCEKQFVKWLSGHSKRRWGGELFYKHATLPPPAVETKYVFHTDMFEETEKKGHYSVFALRASGVTVEEAYIKIKDQIPEGHRVWTYHEEDEDDSDNQG